MRGCNQSASYAEVNHQHDSILLRAQKKLWCIIQNQEPVYQLSVTSARVHVRVNCVDDVQESFLCGPVWCSLRQKKMSTIVVVQISDMYVVHSSFPFILAKMAEEEVAKLVVGNDSGMYKTGSPGDDAPPNACPSTVDRSNMPGISAEMDHKDSYVGDDAQSKHRKC